ncbi:hypothetical protein GALMADRAFT_139336 [Galerina marginata CBS 339.88]|uniref:Uncharacterized protein n=1 Tax=Galerina marginata (strain CBS 339.88) TaxID=685588 RepID=A0A067T2I6_GALM3|nr:hypothetical protein GALMADRAFT_139336 [Galerina marginata CBS 339.88]
MLTLSSSPDFSHIPPQKFIQDAKKEKHILDYQPAEVVDIAIQALQNVNVKLIEWRALLYRRMNVPVRVINYSYVVPDDDLEGASSILARLGLPLSSPSKVILKATGDFAAQGRYHRITQTTLSSGVQHLVLYPLSFSTLSFSEVTLEAPFHIQPSVRCTKIYVPPPPVLYASIIRMMLRYPRYCSTRTGLQSDLSELVDYHLLCLEGGYVDSEDDELWEDLQIEQRISDAVFKVLHWDQEWREGEEWIGDALAAVVRGTVDIDDLPDNSS